jgi:hypothetical protein
VVGAVVGLALGGSSFGSSWSSVTNAFGSIGGEREAA